MYEMIELKNILPLFASNLYTYSIDPSLYDKNKIIETVISNYNKNPDRNNWNPTSTLHHYYNDWDNKSFDTVDLSTLLPIYTSIFNNFIGLVSPGAEYSFNIENITVCADNSHTMSLHDHIAGDGTIFACVHYLKCNDYSAELQVVNPNSFFIYPALDVEKSITRLDDNIHNSGFFKEWAIKPVIDNLIIFPSYLKHKVVPQEKTGYDFRIAIAINVVIN
jgi:hypothetical protein